MKLYAFRTHRQTADYYVSTFQQDPFTGEISYVWLYMGVIKLTIYGRGQNLNIYTDEVLAATSNGKLRNLRDRDGHPIMEAPDGASQYEYIITEADPVLNALGQGEGYRYLAKQSGSPRIKRQAQG